MTRAEGRVRLRAMLVEHFGDRWPDAYRAFWLSWRTLGMPEFDQCDSGRALSAMAYIVAGMVYARSVVCGTREPLAMVSGSN